MVIRDAVDICGVKRRREPRICWVLVFIWLGLAATNPAQVLAGSGGSTTYTVERVYDGDTILVSASGQRKVIRLLGIDAPETSKEKGQPGQPYSQKSRRHLSDLVLKRQITLAIFGEDRYQRTLAVVYCDRQDINKAMIQAGLAEVYRGRTPDRFDKIPYLQAEEQARKAGIGMWRQGADYMSPIRWKHPR